MDAQLSKAKTQAAPEPPKDTPTPIPERKSSRGTVPSIVVAVSCRARGRHRPEYLSPPFTAVNRAATPHNDSIAPFARSFEIAG